jgi:ABC-type transport system involved in multi-copper enzyme maturation permease subunit
MNTLRALYHLALADFFERTRRYSFLLILAAVIYLGIMVNNGSLGMDLGSTDPNSLLLRYRGVLNSAWIGTMTVMVMNTFLGLFGFYLVNDCIKRDIRTGVGQIIATTPVSRAMYLIGKWISNCLVLFLMVLIMAAAAAIMVLLNGKATLDLGSLLMPFIVVSMPFMALIAAFAVIFETIPLLRGAAGNVVYFFTFLSTIMALAFGGSKLPFLNDPIGQSLFAPSVYEVVAKAFPEEPISNFLSVGGFNIEGAQFKFFNWTGITWTAEIICKQWFWAVIGLGLILLSAVWFARFDPSREGSSRKQVNIKETKQDRSADPQKHTLHIALPSLSPLISKLAQVNSFLGVMFAELRMLLNGRRWWWWANTIGLNVAIFTSPIPAVKDYLLPIAWLWPLTIWSGMGNREKMKNTYQMVFSSSRPVIRQLPAAWLAGILASALLTFAGVAFSIMEGNVPGLIGWLGAVVFVPTLALTLGVISSSNRVFEVVYLIWWYIGPMQKMSGLDFTNGTPQIYLLAAAGLLLLSAFWRGRQVRA